MDYRTCSEIIMKRVMPQSHPVAIKIIKGGDPFPEDVRRPSHFGIKIALCQWINLARRWGWVVGAEAQDINCTPCLAGYGFKKLKEKADLGQFFVDMGYFDALEPALSLAEQLEVLEPGEVRGITISPLAKIQSDPDVVLIYGTPAQMTRLAYSSIQSSGRLIHSVTGFGLSCLSAVMPHWKGEPTLVHPGRGERMLGGTDDMELCFSLPGSQLEAFVNGLEVTHKKGLRFPIQGYVLYEPAVIPAMKALEEKLEEV